jgi:ABC-type transport system involved in multi-copper enzyme maturation permease subunit
MFVAIPLMAVFFYLWPPLAPWYVCYVLLFNMLVGPVFSADRITSERERETLELLLTTTISPWQILWGKLFSGLRVSTVLTMFLVWPVLLACAMNSFYWSWANVGTMVAYVIIISLACVTTATVALFASVIFRKTSVALMTAYLAILVLFALPPAVGVFVKQFIVNPAKLAVAPTQPAEDAGDAQINPPAQAAHDSAAENVADQDAKDRQARDTEAARIAKHNRAIRIEQLSNLASVTSPFSVTQGLPLVGTKEQNSIYATTADPLAAANGWTAFWLHMLFTLLLNCGLLGLMVWLFNVRWRVTY